MRIYGAILINDALRSLHVFYITEDSSVKAACKGIKRGLVDYAKDERLGQGEEVLVRVSPDRQKAVFGDVSA